MVYEWCVGIGCWDDSGLGFSLVGFCILVFDFRLEFGGLVLGLGGLVGFGALGCLYNFL